jgi:DNA polymerase III delta subunit
MLKTSIISQEDFVIRFEKSLAELSSRQPLNLSFPIFFFGQDALRLKRTGEWIFEKASAVIKSKEDLQIISARNLTTKAELEKLYVTLQSTSLFSSYSCLIINDIETLPKRSIEGFINSIVRPNPKKLLFIAGVFKDLPSEYQNIFPFSFSLKQLSPAASSKWIRREVQSRGIANEIEAEAIETLMQYYDGKFDTVVSEIERLSLLISNNQPLTTRLILEHTASSNAAVTFDLIHAIARKDLLSASKITQSLLDNGMHPLQLNSFLSRACRMLLAHTGRDLAGLNSELSQSWYWGKIKSAQNQFSERELRRALAVIKKADSDLKGGKIEEGLVVNLTVSQLTFRG